MPLKHALPFLLLLPLAAPGADSAAPRLQLEGKAELFRRDHVSTPRTEIRITFSPDGRRMLWGSIGWKGGPGGWEILESVLTPAGWSEPQPASFNTPANEFDPSFAPDGSGVYFFSNRPGGLGGDDLYFAPFDAAASHYGPAQNLGPAVNSAGDEWAPVVSPDGARLLFATDGRGGRGRHDLFLSHRDAAGGWAPAENLGDLNTADEDFDATFLHDGQTLVFSSGRFDGRVALYWSACVNGNYRSREELSDAVNSAASDAMTNGPSISPAEPGWLYFSAHRDESAGRMDIYRIRYRL